MLLLLAAVAPVLMLTMMVHEELPARSSPANDNVVAVAKIEVGT